MYTAFSPGFHSSRLKMTGPEPVYSEICSDGEVSATRLGIMNGTLELGLARLSSTSPYGSFRISLKVFGSTAWKEAIEAISFWPMTSRAAQRLIEAMQSSEVTGAPSCHFRPSRSVNV